MRRFGLSSPEPDIAITRQEFIEIMNAHCGDPFANIGDTDPGEVPGKEDKKMATKPLSNAAMPTAKPAFRLSTFAQEGEFTALEALEGQEVMLHSFDEITTKFGSAYRTGATDENGAVHVLCLGQMLIKPAIDALLADFGQQEEEVPFPIAVRFVKKGRAWTIE